MNQFRCWYLIGLHYNAFPISKKEFDYQIIEGWEVYVRGDNFRKNNIHFTQITVISVTFNTVSQCSLYHQGFKVNLVSYIYNEVEIVMNFIEVSKLV